MHTYPYSTAWRIMYMHEGLITIRKDILIFGFIARISKGMSVRMLLFVFAYYSATSFVYMYTMIQRLITVYQSWAIALFSWFAHHSPLIFFSWVAIAQMLIFRISRFAQSLFKNQWFALYKVR